MSHILLRCVSTSLPRPSLLLRPLSSSPFALNKDDSSNSSSNNSNDVKLSLDRTSYYDDLQLTPEASSEDIKSSFYDLSKKYHPDLNQDNPEALAKFQSISEAFNVLGNAKNRKLYDRGVLGKDTSVAEQESRAYKYEGEKFMERRAAFREEFNNDSHLSRRHGSLDHYIKQTRRSQNIHRILRQSDNRNTPGGGGDGGSSSSNRGVKSRGGGGGLGPGFIMVMLFVLYVFSKF